jgi:hypothetical protein
VRSGGDRSTFGGWSDLAGDRWRFFVSHNLLSDLASVNRDFAGELERKSHSVALDDRDSNNAERGRRISDDDFLAFATGDYQHVQVLLPERRAFQEQVSDQSGSEPGKQPAEIVRLLTG